MAKYLRARDNRMRSLGTSSHLPVKTDRHVGENIGSDGDVRNGLDQRAHEATEWPWTLRDHVEAIERYVEQCVENISAGEIDEKVVRRRSHAAMGENDPDDNGIAARGQQHHRAEQEEKGELDMRIRGDACGNHRERLTCVKRGRTGDTSSSPE